MPKQNPNNVHASQGVATRVAASQLVNQVLTDKVTIDEALGKVATKHRLNDDDKRLVHAISGTVFRKLPYIDAVLRQVMNRNRDPSPAHLHHLLRVGAAQLLFMAVAPHAAVDTCVSAVGSLRLNPQKGLVNAVLRSVQRQKDQLLKDEPNALRMLPEWLQSRWIAQYGELESIQAATAMAQEAPLDLIIKDADASHEMIQMQQAEPLLSDSVRVAHRVGHIQSWPGYTAGAWWVQDLASSLPINMLGEVTDKSVLDMCAAPGGKTQQLAHRGARVTAIDIAPFRMTRLTENLRRLNLSQRVQTHVADARRWRPKDPLDVIVLDAPCSATGTLRRHPELPWIHDEKSFEKLTATQGDLMRHAANLLKHDGIMLYCTCSMEAEEGENQVDSFLNQFKDFKEMREIPAVVQPYIKRGINDIGWRTNLNILADKGGMDGFFIALLKKI